MKNPVKARKTKGERTLWTSLLLSAPGPVVTGLSVLSSYSATQIADFLRRSTELAVLFVSWRIYRKLQRNDAFDQAEKSRLERLANLCAGAAMVCTGAMMLVIASFRLSSHEPGGNVTMGLVIAVLGLVANACFWFRYRALAREQFNAVIAAQQKMYRAKSFVDLCVVATLAAVTIAPVHPATRWIDILGSVIVACYLLWNGFASMRRPRN